LGGWLLDEVSGIPERAMTWTDERSLDEADLDRDPHRQFGTWLQEAVDVGEAMPRAMALATTNREGLPSVRMVLIEDVDERGFAFQTNLDSPKARDLAAVPQAAAVFFWGRLLRQVRVTGPVSALSRDEVAAYFDVAPPGIRTMLRACRQSKVIPDRAALERSFAEALTSADTGVPEDWGGYRLRVQTIEFWQGRQNWLQDRLRYTRTADDAWRIERLVP
jgi:pyridoxamine 5'-phosphate oxidase